MSLKIAGVKPMDKIIVNHGNTGHPTTLLMEVKALRTANSELVEALEEGVQILDCAHNGDDLEQMKSDIYTVLEIARAAIEKGREA